MKKYICLAVLLVGLQLRLYSQKSVSTAKDVYYCTPCGNPACDTIAFDHPGICPICHMPLIKRVNSGQSVTPQINNNYTGYWEGSAKTTDQQLKFSLDILISPSIKVLFNATE